MIDPHKLHIIICYSITHSKMMFFVKELSFKMARGQQKIQSQQKNAEKMAKLKKGQSHDQKKAAQAALTYKCTVCMVID